MDVAPDQTIILDFLMNDGLRKSHLRKAHQVGLSEVGLPGGNLVSTDKLCWIELPR